MSNAITDLRPCPFCGCEDVHVYSTSNFHGWWVECKNPGCRAGTAAQTRPDRQEAVDAWNHRATNPAEVEDLRTLVKDLMLIMPGASGCGDFSRVQRTYSDAVKLLAKMP